MRLPVLSVLGAAALLSGCVVAPPPGGVPPVPRSPVVVTPAPAPTSPDAASRNTARQVVNAEMAKRLPGRNVAPLTDCVLANATMAELADLSTLQGSPGAADAVASIVSRPAASQCIAQAAVG